MIRDFALPDLGEGLTESEIVAWRVKVGDHVELNQIIADVETAKAVVELPSPFEGTVTALHAAEGETVNVGEKLFSCDTGDGAAAAEAAAPVESAASAEAAAPAAAAQTADVAETREPTLVGYGAGAERGPKRRARRLGGGGASALSDDLVQAPPEHDRIEPDTATHSVNGLHDADERPERPRSTPPVRKLARDLGIDLERIAGTGERGLITRADVEAAASGTPTGEPATQATPAATSAATDAVADETRIPIKGVRKHTAAAMVRSAFTAPHVTEFLTVDVTATMELLASVRADRAYAGHKVTPLTVVAKALCIAAARTPEVNSRWDEDAQEIVRFGHVNLGIATATDRGLVVPNLKGAERMTLIDLADAIASLAETARAGKTAPADLSGGTISITNIGVFGIDAGTPILNPGEAAILAMGAVRRTPWEHRGEIALRDVMTLSLSFDHRLVDGEQGSRFLADIGRILRDPGLALTMA
ncbi:pyruvate dehydrogenase E2 component (dihydrolipoamide acetyltransferase) [Agromyces flavus]|uniref:Dihydrolipoamide acetyltransferase component of pyruvate dehydrogenase complex n=1 Tax=Agromyces flavus TaxID=589382 RepID=A0A1H1T855_9MICO|nr:dihydrolipoamide acetyltransferase family protein [Agromyces flavus]MCP2368472.1 pyruvate dehydrogenase E2 component (dihydrolipoamide acetyltransferase) [Agromyces flavus]GGI47932.1 dihydrolipoamide acetyltransferase component of pyruvate dehydrogenase complex [Agromyces flavus]SDS56397.1 pyruvate dehydrogenase E2 component (dihydrolipoamide acetyltransferase) [Agromyces flavus]